MVPLPDVGLVGAGGSQHGLGGWRYAHVPPEYDGKPEIIDAIVVSRPVGEALPGDASCAGEELPAVCKRRAVQGSPDDVSASDGTAAGMPRSVHELEILGGAVDAISGEKRVPVSAIDGIVGALPSRCEIVKRLDALRTPTGEVMAGNWSVCELEVLGGVLDGVPDGKPVPTGAIDEAVSRLPGRCRDAVRWRLGLARRSRGGSWSPPWSVRELKASRGVLDVVPDGMGERPSDADVHRRDRVLHDGGRAGIHGICALV
jgi:hypothetical protein